MWNWEGWAISQMIDILDIKSAWPNEHDSQSQKIGFHRKGLHGNKFWSAEWFIATVNGKHIHK